MPQPAQRNLYRNNGDGTFTDVTKRAGSVGVRRSMGLAVLSVRRRRPSLHERGRIERRKSYVGRGVAVGDYDNDGDADLLLLCVSRPPRLLRNDGGNDRYWLGVRLIGTKSGRDAIGAKVTVTARGRSRMRCLVGGASYLTASDSRVLFGLGETDKVDALEVRWPGGSVERFGGVRANQYVTITEGRGAAP